MKIVKMKNLMDLMKTIIVSESKITLLITGWDTPGKATIFPKWENWFKAKGLFTVRVD